MKKFKNIYIEITNICNLDCPFCHNNEREKKYMKVAEYQHVLHEVRKYTDYIYLHVKGEPLLNPELPEILEASKGQFSILLTTNGTLLDKNMEAILRNAKTIHQINVSLHAFRNDDLKELDTLANLIRINEEQKLFKIQLRFWVENRNEGLIMNYLKEKSGVEILKSKNSFFSVAEEFEWPSIEKNEPFDGTCLGGKRHIAILVDGTVVPCCLDGEGIIALGNIFEESLEEIMAKKRYTDLVKGFNDNKCTEELCRHCTYKRRFL